MKKKGPDKLYHESIQVNIPRGWREKSARVAKEQDMTQSAWVRQLIRRALVSAGELNR